MLTPGKTGRNLLLFKTHFHWDLQSVTVLEENLMELFWRTCVCTSRPLSVSVISLISWLKLCCTLKSSSPRFLPSFLNHSNGMVRCMAVPSWNILTILLLLQLKYFTNPTDTSDHLTFPLIPLKGWHFCFLVEYLDNYQVNWMVCH